MRNKNFHSRRIGTINIHTRNYDEKIEIHEIAKAKLSVCCCPEVCRLNNNSVTIINKQNKQCSAEIPKNSTRPAMQLEGTESWYRHKRKSYR